MATHKLKDLFDSNLNIAFTKELVKAISHFTEVYETRGTNALAFNSYMLGVDPCFFKTSDRDDFFALFSAESDDFRRIVMHVTDDQRKVLCGVSNSEINQYSKKAMVDYVTEHQLSGVMAGEIRKWVSDSNAVNTNFAVISDPFNLFITWVTHRLLNTTGNGVTQKDTAYAAFKALMLLQYKFFTSLVNYRYKYTPNREAMIATYESLTFRFDIKVHGTWRKVLESRAEQLLDPKSIHYRNLVRYDDDRAILYFITDVQTRLRNQINIFTEEFMKIKEEQDKVGSYSLAGTDKEGEKVILDTTGGYESVINNVVNDAMSVPRFIDETSIRILHGFFPALPSNTIKSFLISYTEYATKQSRAGQTELMKKIDGRAVDIGVRSLITGIINKSLGYCIRNGISIDKPLLVLKSIRDIYSSSRTADTDILDIKTAVTYVVTQTSHVTRDSTIASLRLAFIMYIVMMALRYLK